MEQKDMNTFPMSWVGLQEEESSEYKVQYTCMVLSTFLSLVYLGQ